MEPTIYFVWFCCGTKIVFKNKIYILKNKRDSLKFGIVLNAVNTHNRSATSKTEKKEQKKIFKWLKWIIFDEKH